MPEHVPVIEAIDVSRSFPAPDGSTCLALSRISLIVQPGEVVAVMGPSGSGKSTLLALLGGLDRPTSGAVRLLGIDVRSLPPSEQARYLRRTCGFIPQGLALLPQATAAENVELPLALAGGDPQDHGRRSAAALDRVGLSAHVNKLPDQLSGGEQQRVSIARALVHEPAVVLADEPTASLDSRTSRNVVALLVEAALERNAAVVLVTHDPDVAAHAHRTITMRSGRMRSDTAAATRMQMRTGGIA